MAPPSQRPLRVGLLGYGMAGRVFHGPLIAACPDLALAAVVTADPGRQAEARSAHPGARVLPTAEALLARPGDLDLVVVATPNRSHVPLARAALDAGLPVVVDKPLAATSLAARDLIHEAERRRRLLTVFQNRRWDGDFLTVRRLVTEGALGPVRRLESRFEKLGPLRGGWRERGEPAEAGGLLYDLGAHLVDQALQLLGPAEDVYAELDRRRPGAAADDDSFVAVTHASGARSHLWMSKVAGQRGPRFRVLGERAAYVKYGLDGQEAALGAGGVPGSPGWGEEPEAAFGRLGADDEVRPVPTAPGDYLAFYRAVAAALRSGGPPPVDPRDAVAVLEVIEAAQRSADRRTVERLAPARCE